MSPPVSVHMLPSLVQPDAMAGAAAVMLDVLRASTTIVHALAAGATAVVPCGEIDEARRIAAEFPPEERLLGGERDGLLIEGFDLDNSPRRYTPETVGGKTIVFTTTNGTRALLRSRRAEPILIGAFVNLGALIDRLVQMDGPVHLVCAGTDGEITAEDVLLAGSIAAALQERGGFERGNDETRIAVDFCAACGDDDSAVRDVLFESAGGRNLRRRGFEADIDRAARRDLFRMVPAYNAASGRIVAER